MAKIAKVDFGVNKIWVELVTGTGPGCEVRVLKVMPIFENLGDLKFTARGLKSLRLLPSEMDKIVLTMVSGAARREFK